MSVSRSRSHLAASAPSGVELPGIDGPEEAGLLSLAQKSVLMNRIYRRGDRLAMKFICLHSLIAFVLATFYQTWLVTGVVTFCAVAMFAVSTKLLPGSFITRCLAGVSLQIFVALHIYQLHGMAEMHFFFFTACTMLIVYQDWKCLWPGAFVIIAQHLSFALLHNAGLGADLYFFEGGYVAFLRLCFHFSIVLGQVAICGYWAYLLRRQTLASAEQNMGLRVMSDQLHRSEGKFRGLIEHALDIITILKPDGTIAYESPAVETTLGYKPEELIGRSSFELVHPDDWPIVAAAFSRRQENPALKASPVEFRYRHKDGSWRILEAVGSALDANVEGMVINSRDVTERRDAEREAKRRANQQNATSELARQALAGKDLPALLDSAVSLVARALDVEFCYVGERVEGEEDLLMRADYSAVLSAPSQKTAPGGRHSQGGFTLLSNEPVIVEDLSAETRFEATPAAKQRGVRSGLSVVVGDRERVFGVLVTQSTEPRRFTQDDVAFLSSVADILFSALERQRAEVAMRAAKEEAEKANLSKNEFLSRTSHELRTPLNAILGFGQLLELGKLPPKQAESVGHILRAGKHLLGLIDEVLSISRIEAGRMNLSLEPVAVSEMLQECLSLVRQQAEKRSVQCGSLCVATEGRGHFVQADRQRLRQVLLNLLSNAIKYNREGGRVTVSCHVLPTAPGQLPDLQADSYVANGIDTRRMRLEVADTGAGLTEPEIARLFKPFERLRAEYSATEGTGLGLALSKGLIEAMGGTIGVRSVPGEGSIFWVELPMTFDPFSKLDRVMLSTHVPATGSSYEGTILYVEDNLSNLRLIEMLLENRPGLRLLSAQHGIIGLELAQANCPDLILLDLHLPDLPGWKVLEQLQADPRTRGIPTVIISADATPGQITRLLAAGAREYITKPIDVAKLMQTLDKHLCAQSSGLATAAL